MPSPRAEPAGGRLLDEPGPQLGLGARSTAAGSSRRSADRPTGARSAHIRSNVMATVHRSRAPTATGDAARVSDPRPCEAAHGMEFQEVVRRRRMVRNYADRPVDPAVVDRALRNATRAPSAGFSQGWAFVRARHARRRTPLLGAPPPTRPRSRSPTPGCAGMMQRAGRGRALLQQGRLPRPLRRARQGLDRPRRGSLAGALLAHGHRDGQPADPADRRSTRGWAPASSGSRPSTSPPCAREFGDPRHPRPDRRDHDRPPRRRRRRRRGSPSRAARRSAPRRSVVHRGALAAPARLRPCP